MSFCVLQNKTENKKARKELRRRGLDCTESGMARLLRNLKLLKGVNIGAFNKSWDILKTLEFIEQYVQPDEAILEIGAYYSETLCALKRLEYTNLTGVDLNPDIVSMPFQKQIRYIISDFMRTPFAGSSFSAITAISVIEHGFRSADLLSEISRLLKPGGFFIASIDYWPDKIDTDKIKAYGMDWRIFSRDEIKTFFDDAKAYRLKPFGGLKFEASKRNVRWQWKRYTFAWMVLIKN
jgi:SAM-dependent methyltransferase